MQVHRRVALGIKFAGTANMYRERHCLAQECSLWIAAHSSSLATLPTTRKKYETQAPYVGPLDDHVY